jgi:hypothetical protein
MSFHVGDQIVAVGGSPLYRIEPEHVAGLVALLAISLVLWLSRRRLGALAPVDQLLVALLVATAAIHIGLVVGHDDHGDHVRVLFAVDGAALAFVARRVARGGTAGKLGVAVLVGSLVAYWISTLRGEAPDQVGMLAKLVEIAALAIVFRPSPTQRLRALRSFAGSAAIVLFVFVSSASAWLGAYRASEPDRATLALHEHGAFAPPGTILPPIPQRAPTLSEAAAAAALVDQARAALARYSDPAVAAADGYRVQGLSGVDFHANNPAYEKDGRVLDPARPETLVYAVAPDGHPVLIGALFQMPNIGERGPAIGGPLTVWHAHEQVCVSLLPPSLSGLVSPFGSCPIGSFALPLTGEMIHVWIVPGAPHPIGDLDAEWRKAYLASVSQH